jgi:hypothetical protein
MRLNLKLRPIVAFDVNNPQHRKDYARFLQTHSWGHCPVRYELDEVCGEMQGAIQRRLLDYYSQQDIALQNWSK